MNGHRSLVTPDGHKKRPSNGLEVKSKPNDRHARYPPNNVHHQNNNNHHHPHHPGRPSAPSNDANHLEHSKNLSNHHQPHHSTAANTALNNNNNNNSNHVHQQTPSNHQGANEAKKNRNYKLIGDPCLNSKYQQKVFRFDGIVPPVSISHQKMTGFIHVCVYHPCRKKCLLCWSTLAHDSKFLNEIRSFYFPQGSR